MSEEQTTIRSFLYPSVILLVSVLGVCLALLPDVLPAWADIPSHLAALDAGFSSLSKLDEESEDGTPIGVLRRGDEGYRQIYRVLQSFDPGNVPPLRYTLGISPSQQVGLIISRGQDAESPDTSPVPSSRRPVLIQLTEGSPTGICEMRDLALEIQAVKTRFWSRLGIAILFLAVLLQIVPSLRQYLPTKSEETIGRGVLARYSVVVLSAIFILTRALFPQVRLDEISLAFFGILALAVLIPDIGSLAERIRRLRIGGVEVELVERQVEQLSEQAEHVVERVSEQIEEESFEGARIPQGIGVSREARQRIAEAAQDPRSALLIVAIEIEDSIQRLAVRYGLQAGLGRQSARRILHELADRRLISREVIPLFNEFWEVRNRVVHDANFDIRAGKIYQLVDVGITILELLSVPDEMIWEADARRAVDRLLRQTEWDTERQVAILPDLTSAGEWHTEVESLEELWIKLREEAVLGAHNSMPFEGGEPVFEVDYDGIVENFIDQYEEQIRSLGWDL